MPDVPTAPTAAGKPNSLYPEQIEMLETLFSTLDFLTIFPTNWYLMGICQEYDTPEDISMFRLFNFGMARSRDEYIMTEDEIEYLSQFPRFASHFEDGWEVCRIPREDGSIRFTYTATNILSYWGGEAVIKPVFGGFQMISNRHTEEPPAE